MTDPHYTPPTSAALIEACRRLAVADPALAPLVAATPVFEWRLRPGGLYGLAKIIVGQQVSTAAAESIWRKLEAGLGRITAETLLAVPAEALQPSGLSR